MRLQFLTAEICSELFFWEASADLRRIAIGPWLLVGGQVRLLKLQSIGFLVIEPFQWCNSLFHWAHLHHDKSGDGGDGDGDANPEMTTSDTSAGVGVHVPCPDFSLSTAANIFL